MCHVEEDRGGGAGQLIAGAPAYAADPESAGVALIADGTGQGTANGCAITGAGGDNTSTDGVVCTNDTITYGWSVGIPDGQAVTATFTQTLPPGVSWQADNVTNQCENGSSGGSTWTGTWR